MKNSIIAIAVLLITGKMLSQTRENKLGLTGGGGFQNYKGDLGSAFKFNNNTSYGAFIFNASYYTNRSFDIGVFGSIGDYGFCQDRSVANKAVDVAYRCPGCDRVGLGNLSSRLYSAGGMLKYKFANGYLLKEDSRIKPYVYAGAAYNRTQDIMKMNCVSVGSYSSLNAGVGAKYYVTDRINVGYNLSLGYFLSDNVDFMNHGKGSDMYLQNSVTVGIDLY